MGVVDGVVIVEREEAVAVDLWRPIVTSGGRDALFPNYFGADLFNSDSQTVVTVTNALTTLGQVTIIWTSNTHSAVPMLSEVSLGKTGWGN